MKRLIAYISAILFATGIMTSCSDNDVVKTQLDAPTVSAGYKTVSCLSFNWDPVEGATQYAYELRDPEGTLVNGDVTTTTSVLATGLKPNTTYTMTVWAYAAVTGNKSTSPIATITATTNEVIPLASPTPTAAPGNGGITIVWPEVEHATAYIVTYEKNGENISITTTTNSVVLTDLSTGEHTVYIQAISDDENYCNSEIVAVTFIRDKQEIDRKELYYESKGLNMNFTGYLVTYDDGSYAIEGLYGSDDKLEFTIDENSEILVTNAYKENPPYYYVKAGNYTLCLYIATGYSSFNKTDNDMYFYVYVYEGDTYLNGGYDYISWQTSSFIDNLCGEYTETTSCYDYTIDFTNWTEVTEQQSTVTITKTGDNTIDIFNFYGWQDTFSATVDEENQTITIDIKDGWGSYYTFADAQSESTAVVGTIDENGVITIKNWAAWYYGVSYIYGGAVSVLRKK